MRKPNNLLLRYELNTPSVEYAGFGVNINLPPKKNSVIQVLTSVVLSSKATIFFVDTEYKCLVELGAEKVQNEIVHRYQTYRRQ